MSIEEVLRQELTDEQYEAVVDTNNEVLCLACAGSGKSTTIAFRIARLIAEGESPDSLIAITFTEKAADSIKLRVAETLPKIGFNPELLGATFIGTVHSYCKNLLGELDAVYRQYDVLDENRLILYLISRYSEIGLERIKTQRNSRYFRTIKEVANAWMQFNNECFSFEDVSQHDELLGQTLHQIDTFLQRDHFIDYSLMIRLIVDAIDRNDPNIIRATNNLKHIMVDEYQDTYPLQDRLFRGLHERSDTLFVVGDDDQSIYAWNGADVSNIMEFHIKYPDYGHHELSINFRSTDVIVSSSSGFISRQLGSQRMPKTPTAYPENNNHPNQVGKFFFQNRLDEAEWVAERIQYLIGKSYSDKGVTRGLCPSDFAILMRSTQQPEQNDEPRHRAFTDALRERGIATYIESEGSIFRYQSVNIIKEAFELLRSNDLDRITLQDFFSNKILSSFPNANFDTVSAVMSRWQRDIHQPGRRKVKPQQLLHDMLEAFNFAETEFNDLELHAIGQFSKIMNDVESVYFSIDTTYRFTSILNFLNYIANPVTADDYKASSHNVLQRPNAVFISTIHKAKGLEFPVVFVVDAQSGRYPGRSSNYNGWLPSEIMQDSIRRGAYVNNREGSIRLFYTAITRAERFMYVTGCRLLPNGVRPNSRSVFEQELQHSSIIEDPRQLPEGMTDTTPAQRVDENIMPTSFSDIKYYLSCPKNYQFRKIFGFNPVVPDLYGYGLTIHTSIARIHQEYQDRAPNIQEAEDITRSTFHLKHVPQANDPVENPGPYERGLEKAVEIVTSYTSTYEQEFTQEKQIEQRFEIPAQNTIISGSIDLLIRENADGDIVEASVIDFKSIDEPDEDNELDWIDLSLQVQLYANAAIEVLGENARTGAVHLLRENSRIQVPITHQAITNAIENIEWAVCKIIEGDFPMRPHPHKCQRCDFNKLCAKRSESFIDETQPSMIFVPEHVSNQPLLIKAFSQHE